MPKGYKCPVCSYYKLHPISENWRRCSECGVKVPYKFNGYLWGRKVKIPEPAPKVPGLRRSPTLEGVIRANARRAEMDAAKERLAEAMKACERRAEIDAAKKRLAEAMKAAAENRAKREARKKTKPT